MTQRHKNSREGFGRTDGENYHQEATVENGQPSCLATATTASADLVAGATELWLANQDRAALCIRRIFSLDEMDEVDGENLLDEIGFKSIKAIVAEWEKGEVIRYPGAMINKIAENACNDILRSWQRHPTSPLPEDVTRLEQILWSALSHQPYNLESEILDREIMHIFGEGLLALKDHDQDAADVLALFILTGTSAGAIGVMLHKSRSWVYVKLDVGKDFMRLWLANYVELEG